METFEVQLSNGIRLSCRAAGRPDAPLLLFLHGFPEAAFVWDDVLRRLAQQFRCVAPNLRGYEASSAPSGVQAYHPKLLLQDLALLIGTLGGHARAVIAHDWGGALAWSLAARQPSLFDRLIIINAPHPATFLRDLQHDVQQQTASAYMNFLIRDDAATLLAENDYARLWRFFTSMGNADPTCGAGAWLDDVTRQRYRAVWQRGLDPALNYYRASPLRPPTALDQSVMTLNLPAAAVTVHLPTLVIWAEADRALPPSLLTGLQAFVPQLRIERLPGATHWVVHEQPDHIAGLVADFATVGG